MQSTKKIETETPPAVPAGGSRGRRTVADAIAETKTTGKAAGRSMKGRWWLAGECELRPRIAFADPDDYGLIFSGTLQFRSHRSGPSCVVVVNWLSEDEITGDPDIVETVLCCDDLLSCGTVGEVEDVLLAGHAFGGRRVSIYNPSCRGALASLLVGLGLVDEESGS